MDNKQNSKGHRINYDINDIETENSRPIHETRPNRVARDDGRESGEREKTKATREINTEGKSKGLDNSSFSNENKKASKWQEYLDKSYKTTRTRTNLKDIKKKEQNSIKLPHSSKISKSDINLLKNPTKESSYDIGNTPTRHEIIEKYKGLAKNLLGSLFDIKDKAKRTYYQINTIKRNLRDIMPKTFQKIIKSNNLKKITFHELRHTSTSLLID